MVTENDVSGGCILPLAQAIVSIALAGGLTYGAGVWFDAGEPISMAVTLGIAAGGLTWLAGLQRWIHAAYPDTFYPPEPEGAEPPMPPALVRLELTHEGGRQVQLIDLPASVEQLKALAGGLLTGATFAESQWTGAGGLFTRAQFAALRSELIRRGLAAWNSPGTPARGVTLTAPGRAAMRHFASMAGGSVPGIQAKGNTR